MAYGIATPPVEGRVGAMLVGKDQSFGSAQFQAGIVGGDPMTYGAVLASPTVWFKRQPKASFVRRP